MSGPRIIVHGGAGSIPDDLVEAFREGCRQAARLGWRILRGGGAAEDAVEAAVCYMEDDEAFDAGRGSFLNRDGIVELDAGFMEGRDLHAGAVAAVRDIANPVILARRVLESEHVLLIGEGATRFGLEHGLTRCAPEWLVVPREVARWQELRRREGSEGTGGCSDTVGAVALDGRGHLAVTVSTGGRPYKLPGRVGDVPCTGAGFYADDSLGAAASTGDGEAIMRVVMAKWAVDALAGGADAPTAAWAAIEHLHRRVGGHAGLILLDRSGQVGCAFNTPRMGRAWNDGEAIVAAVDPA